MEQPSEDTVNQVSIEHNAVLGDPALQEGLKAIHPAWGDFCSRVAGEAWGLPLIDQRTKALITIAVDVVNTNESGTRGAVRGAREHGPETGRELCRNRRSADVHVRICRVQQGRKRLRAAWRNQGGRIIVPRHRTNYYADLAADFSKPAPAAPELSRKLLDDAATFIALKEPTLPAIRPVSSRTDRG